MIENAIVCGDCRDLGLRAEMTGPEMLKFMTERAADHEIELADLRERAAEVNDDTDLMRAVHAWHRARSCLNRSEGELLRTDEDLSTACRHVFDH